LSIIFFNKQKKLYKVLIMYFFKTKYLFFKNKNIFDIIVSLFYKFDFSNININ